MALRNVRQSVHDTISADNESKFDEVELDLITGEMVYSFLLFKRKYYYFGILSVKDVKYRIAI